jgi:hypothetical protein
MPTRPPAPHFGKVVLPQEAGNALRAAHQSGKLHGGRGPDQQMRRVILAVHLLHDGTKPGADPRDGVAQHLAGAISEHTPRRTFVTMRQSTGTARTRQCSPIITIDALAST